MRRFTLVAAAVAVSALLAPGPGSATTPAADSRVGALFFPSVLGLLPTLGGPHYCSASVIHSTHGNLIITAAHCVYGTGAGIEFAPGFANGTSPDGIWDVTAAYVDPAWKKSNDPRHDVAILKVASQHHNGTTRSIEQIAGAFTLGVAPTPGSTVTVTGYPAGSGGTAVSCSNSTTTTADYPTIACTGFVDGTSGGPWVQGSTTVGVIGGLHEGGCTPEVSYSAPFDSSTLALLARATTGGHGDAVFPPLTDGC
jgi:hypothetical protein